MKKKIVIAGSILFVIWAIIFLSLYNSYSDNVEEKQKQEYPSLNNELYVSGILIDARRSKGFTRGIFNITLNNGIKFSIYKTTRNYDYDKDNYDFYYSLNIGDSIFKNRHSDSIFVFRGDKIYYYIYGKVINEKE